NNDIRPEGYSAPLSADFDTPHRAERLHQVLETRRDWTSTEQAAVQTDAVSLWAQEVVRASAGSYSGDAGRAYQLLADWDGSMNAEGSGSPAAALFTFFERELQKAVFNDEESAHDVEGLRSRWHLERLLHGEMSESWFDDAATADREDRTEILERALSRAWDAARRKWGDDPRAWSYGEIHTLELQHPLGALPLIGSFFNRGPFPVDGSATTVDAMMGRWQKDEQIVVAGPSMRWVVDFSHPDSGLAVLPGGQSGHPADSHYDDQLPLYLGGRLRDAPWSEEALAREAVETLRLHP
ncbi:MAG: penicillin acylase family protein, partial [Acidobacteria bacterium]|nr:penicillin acylase family protein [Acidobacteriota bacterium]